MTRDFTRVTWSVSPDFATSKSASYWALACKYCPSTSAVTDPRVRCSSSNCAWRFARSARASFNWAVASRYSCSTCGLLSSSRTVPGPTAWLGWTKRFSMRPVSLAAITAAVSGTRVPIPRSCRTISPSLTVSEKTTAASTPGATGSMRAAAQATARNAATAPDPATFRRMRFRRACPMCGLSMRRFVYVSRNASVIRTPDARRTGA